MRMLLFALFSLGFAVTAPAAPPESSTPKLRLDHVWIAVPPGAAAERAALEKAGFRIAPEVNRHDGQGTASVTVELENGYLELIYADDSVPVSETGAVAKKRFAERAKWQTTVASPFGVQMTRTAATPATLPFETWRITAAWMGPGESLEMLTPRGSPAVTLSIPPHATDEAANRAAIAKGGTAAWKFLHPNGARRLTSVRVTAPDAAGLPPSAAFVNASGAARLEVGAAWLMEVTLDAGRQGRTSDLRPTLPLVVRY